MKATVMTAAGAPDVLRASTVATPEIRTGTEILVRLRAAGVNPLDTKIRSGASAYPLALPAVLGCDGAGVVEAVGPEVTRFQPGDAVYFCRCPLDGERGTYGEYAVLDQRLAAAKPGGISFEEAAAVPLVLITAWESLFHRARLERGQDVLIHGGAGGTGHAAVQLARHAGARVCTTVSTGDKARFVTSLGADAPIRYRQRSFGDAVLEWTGGRGVDVALDTVGGKTFEHSFAAVRVYGDLVTLLQPPADTRWAVARQRNLRIALELMLTPGQLGMADAQSAQTGILERCTPLLADGTLRIHVGDVLPVEDAAEAHRRIEAGGVTGKLVLAIG